MANNDDDRESSGGLLSWIFGGSDKKNDEPDPVHYLTCTNCGAEHGSMESKRMCSCSRSE